MSSGFDLASRAGHCTKTSLFIQWRLKHTDYLRIGLSVISSFWPLGIIVDKPRTTQTQNREQEWISLVIKLPLQSPEKRNERLLIFGRKAEPERMAFHCVGLGGIRLEARWDVVVAGAT